MRHGLIHLRTTARSLSPVGRLIPGAIFRFYLSFSNNNRFVLECIFGVIKIIWWRNVHCPRTTYVLVLIWPMSQLIPNIEHDAAFPQLWPILQLSDCSPKIICLNTDNIPIMSQSSVIIQTAVDSNIRLYFSVIHLASEIYLGFATQHASHPWSSYAVMSHVVS